MDYIWNNVATRKVEPPTSEWEKNRIEYNLIVHKGGKLSLAHPEVH